jgi:hypothetical protein
MDGYNPADDHQLDDGIKLYVATLRSAGIETFESCEGGPGHCYAEPTVRSEEIAAKGTRSSPRCSRTAWPFPTSKGVVHR